MQGRHEAVPFDLHVRGDQQASVTTEYNTLVTDVAAELQDAKNWDQQEATALVTIVIRIHNV
jgi:hypothetical protein